MQDISITYSLQKLLVIILGDNEFVPVTEDFCDEIKLTLGKQNLRDLGYFIQTEAGPDEILLSPRLWSYRFWAMSCDRREKAQKYSQSIRDQSFIFSANLKMVTDAIIDEWNLPQDIAMVTARKLLKGKNIQQKLLRLGIEKLYTKIEQLP